MLVEKFDQIISLRRINGDIDDGERRKIELFLQEEHSLFHCIGKAPANLIPKVASGVVDSFDVF